MLTDKVRIMRYRRWVNSFLQELNDKLAPKGNVHKRTLKATLLLYSILLYGDGGPEPPSKRRKK